MKRNNGTLHYIHAKSIPNGTKFVAFFGDGSGASLFLVDDSGHLYDTDMNQVGIAPDNDLQDRGYVSWIELPDSFKFWFEQHEEKRP